MQFGLQNRSQYRMGVQLSEWVAITKPRILVVALVSVMVGYIASGRAEVTAVNLFGCLFLIGCVAVTCSLLNQLIEYEFDRKMERTADRSLAGGRISLASVRSVAFGTGVVGILGAGFILNWLTAVLGVITLLIYVAIYTPLKQASFLGTVFGAISGAAPPVLGWVSAGGSLDSAIVLVFCFLFLWQFPHFLAIATIYRDDYGQVGYRMLPSVGGRGFSAGLLAVLYSFALLPFGVLMRNAGLFSHNTATIVFVLCVVYFLLSAFFWARESINRARMLLLNSLVLLVYVFGAMAVSAIQVA